MQDKLKIIFENSDYLVIDKPAGITVNKSDTTKDEQTLQGMIEDENKIDSKDPDQEFVDRGGIVHRLDKETSGVIIVAKNSTAFRNLQAQFKERRVEKKYIALVHGEIFPEVGEINAPVGRLPWNRKRFGILSGGRESLTLYKVISNYELNKTDTLSLVELLPKTGRTHQIRVHLKYINHPIFSDPLYGGRKTARNDRKILDRVFLHAKEISFFDPITANAVHYESRLPIELEKTLQLISKQSN